VVRGPRYERISADRRQALKVGRPPVVVEEIARRRVHNGRSRRRLPTGSSDRRMRNMTEDTRDDARLDETDREIDDAERN
jgi:hypothetical protein